MGVIFRAKQLSVDRIVAIKMMHARASRSEDGVDRFHSEARACSRLTHPNTVRLYDFGQTTLGNLYMVMELLEGRSLRQVIADEGPVAAPRVLRILMQCAASLAEAHAAGIIHRDIKPENIFVLDLAGAPDFVKLLDFSIAKLTNARLTAAGTIFGTPQYMSPEQAGGKTVDARSDIYALGIVAYAMLSNTLPFHHEDPLKVLKMQVVSPVPPLPADVPDMVAKVVMACLQKNPEKRPASAMALLEACKVWLTTLDPSLDVASDPVLKNTLINTGPPSGMPQALQDELTRRMAEKDEGLTIKLEPKTAIAKKNTMLSASGQQRSLAASPAMATRTEKTMNSVMTTLVHGSAVVPPPARPAPVANTEPSTEKLTGTEALAAQAQGAKTHVQPSQPAPSQQQQPAPNPVAAPPPFAQTAPMTPNPLPQQGSTAAFALACCLVALTFGLGGYYITWALR
tara:strand:- start:35711 stop:37078 length:1368 start_codon:yes stop_codon:yes gene_type:complete